MIEENHEKTTVRLVGTGIWTRDLPNASLVRCHGASSLGHFIILLNFVKVSHWNFDHFLWIPYTYVMVSTIASVQVAPMSIQVELIF